MNPTEYARHRSDLDGQKVSKQAVHQAIARGAIPLLDDGSVDVEAADRDWVPRQTPERALPSKGGEPTAAELARKQAQLKLDREEANWKADRGEMLDRAEALLALESFGAVVGSSIDGWPARAVDALGSIIPRARRKDAIIALERCADDTRRELAKDITKGIAVAKPRRRR